MHLGQSGPQTAVGQSEIRSYPVNPEEHRQATNLADEEAIYREVQAFAAAWRQGDPQALAGCSTEDAVRVGAFGDIQHGQADIEAASDRPPYDRLLGTTFRPEGSSIRLLSADLAVWVG
jgi:uncharacterized protein (TIGR02246 family)